MKNKRFILAMIGLPIIAPFLMAVTPYAETTNEYTGAEITVDNVREDLEKEGYSFYDLTIKNIGRGYIVSVKYDEKGKNYENIRIKDELSPLYFNDAVLEPGGTYNIENFHYNGEKDLEKALFKITAYDNYYENLNLNDVEIIKEEDKEDIYVISCGAPKNDYDYGYNFMITMEYEGNVHCFDLNGNQEGRLSFRAKEGFDKEKAKITKIDVFRYENYHTNYGGLILGGMLCVVLPVFAIAILIVIFCVVYHKINKKKEQNNR